MNQVTVTKTKDYLVLKIPLQAVRERKIFLSDNQRHAIAEGLRAIKEGRVSKPYKNAKEAIAFLRSL